MKKGNRFVTFLMLALICAGLGFGALLWTRALEGRDDKLAAATEMLRTARQQLEDYFYLRDLKARATAGDAAAMLELGQAYRDGTRVGQDAQVAESYISRAAAQGYAPAQYAYAKMLYSLHAKPGPGNRVMFMLTQAAGQGYVPAQAALGRALVNGDGPGGVKNYPAAARWLAEAARGGDLASRDTLATLYLGMEEQWPQLTAEQLTVIEAAAETPGKTYLQMRLAVLYEEGERVEKDMKRAVGWYEKAAAFSGAHVWRRLAALYADGDPEIRDLEKARVLLARAVEKGVGYYDYAFLLFRIDPVKYRDEIIKWAEKSKVERNPRSDGLLLQMKEDDAALRRAKEEAAAASEDASAEKDGAEEQARQGENQAGGDGVFDTACRLLKAPEVRVKVSFAPVAFDHTKTVKEVTLRAAGMFTPQGAAQHAAGLHAASVRYRYDYGFENRRHAKDGNCLGVSFVEMRAEYESTIFIAKEYAEGTCAYNNIKTHELRHRAVDEAVFTEHIPILEKHIAGLLHDLPPMGPMKQVMIPAKKNALRALIREKVKTALKAMREESERRQIFIDTPEEYGKGLADCPAQEDAAKEGAAAP